MNTFSRMWHIKTPEEAKKIINEQILELNISRPNNLEEQALSLVGRDIYEKLIKGYTEKQWGKPCSDLPAFIIKRLPCRFTYNNNYFNDRYQGIPIGGYTQIISKMLSNINVILNTNFRQISSNIKYNKLIYTGCIDEYYNYCLGKLQYRGLKFETECLPVDNYQGNAVVNYTSRNIPYTRIIEHKHFEFGTQRTTIITKEYPCEWNNGDIPYYPINDEINNRLYQKYLKISTKEEHVYFGGRLGLYQYLDMDKVIEKALQFVNNIK